jgi:hypothetical protein
MCRTTFVCVLLFFGVHFSNCTLFRFRKTGDTKPADVDVNENDPVCGRGGEELDKKLPWRYCMSHDGSVLLSKDSLPAMATKLIKPDEKEKVYEVDLFIPKVMFPRHLVGFDPCFGWM